MVFKGLVTNKDNMNKLMLTPLIRYPLLGGSALITFEKAEGKRRVLPQPGVLLDWLWGLPCIPSLGQGSELCPLCWHCTGLMPLSPGH